MASKLYSLKEWLTLDDAASHLASVLSEKVTIADILQLAIQGRLKLSVNLLSGTYANKGFIRDINEARVILYPAGTPFSWLRGDEPATPLEKKLRALGELRFSDIAKLDDEIRRAVADRSVEVVHIGESISETEIVEFENCVQMLSGIYDLPMLSAEKSVVEEMYYPRVGGPDVDPWGLEGVWLERDGHIYRLCERKANQADYDACGREDSIAEWENRYTDPARWFPTSRLPDETAIILRRNNLDAFISSLEASEHARDRDSEVEELRVLEALGLLAEALAQQHPGLYANNGKPKRSGINSIMQVVIEGYANPVDPEAEPIKRLGLGKTTLDETLKDAIEAWERRKQKV